MLLSVKNLNVHFDTEKGPLHALRDVSFSIEQGETLGVVGESGCGKSITNLAILRLLSDRAKVRAEHLKFSGVDLLKKSEKEMQVIRGKEIAMIFQDPMSALNPGLTVGYQIRETLKLHRENLKKTEYHKLSLDLLNQVGIPAPQERLKSYPHELSGGMAQRIMIAMALASSPKLLIADEPTTALDVTIQDQILRLLKDLQKKHKMAMIFVTHDLGVVAQNADRIQVMYAGEVVERGSARQIIDRPKHPYTKSLIEGLPEKNNITFRGHLPSIPGMVPNLYHRPRGCQFHPRCQYTQEKCEQEIPISIDIDLADSNCKCFFPVKEYAEEKR